MHFVISESENENDGAMCLEEVEARAKNLALKELIKRKSIVDPSQYDVSNYTFASLELT